MSGKRYARFIEEKRDELTLRDYLAIDRTLLANERSFLSYVRTAATLLIASITLIKFFPEGWIQTSGEFMLAATAVVFIRGLIRYKAAQHVIAELEDLHEESEETSHGRVATRFLKMSKGLVSVFYK